MSSTLKQELKAWEASFRSDHGRDPTKHDIKLAPEIARKYKEYNKSKQAPVPSVSKIPTKPRPSTSRPPPPPLDDNPFLATDTTTTTTATTTTTTTKSTSGTKTAPDRAKPDGTQYVLANSPSKLRALAALHSTSQSPNRPSGPNWANAAAAAATVTSGGGSGGSSSSASARRATATTASAADFDRSPRKARNPFASPGKKHEIVTIQPLSRGTTLFGDFERLEREKLKKKQQQPSRVVKVRSGMGWGHASDPFDTSAASVGIVEGRGERQDSMQVDEIDDFFGGGGGGGTSAKKEKQQTLTTLAGPLDLSSSSLNPFHASPPGSTTRHEREQETGDDDDDDDDEMLGPSPVKPSTASSSSFQRTSSFGFDQSKPFKPLFDDPLLPPSRLLPPVRSSSSSSSRAGSTKPPPPPPRKVFESSIRTTHATTGFVASSSESSKTTNPRGTKRATDANGNGFGGKGKGKGRASGEMDDLLRHDDDDFYADALDAVEKDLEGSNGGTKGKGKRKRVGATMGTGRGRGRGRGKGKGKVRDTGGDDVAEEGDEVEVDDELRVERDERGGLVLDLRVDGPAGTTEGGEQIRERIMIHQQGRRKDRRGDRDRDEGDEDEDEDEPIHDEISLLDRPLPRPLVSSRTLPVPTNHGEESSTEVHASLPADLVSILSLRASPHKLATSAKDRQVAKLLREPTAIAQGRRRGGLLELEDAVEEEENGAREEEAEGDDDWDEEVDGWKQTGEAMDGYYSGDDGW